MSVTDTITNMSHAFIAEGGPTTECSTCEEHTDNNCNLHAEIAGTNFWPAGHVPEGCVVVFDALAQQDVSC